VFLHEYSCQIPPYLLTEQSQYLIVAHEVTNVGNDRSQLANMSLQAKEELKVNKLTVVADRGNRKSSEYLYK